jgi:WD40 repeat protein/energy-coupling factor transporter ATP-binding protein EcfA2
MTARPEDDPPAPYVGLRPFEFHEASLFYGRGEHIAEMVRTLRKGHFLAVVGSSGSGKSSLVRAGLLPAIAEGFMDAGDEAADWRFVIMRPGLDPYENLLRELLPQVAPGQSLDSATIEFRRQTLRGGPRGLFEVVADSLLPERARLVVLVDQFEEIFRFLERGGPSTPDDGTSLADRRNATLAFVDMLLATTAEGDPHVYVVLTMRSEYLGECEAFLGLSAAIAKSQFLTPRMTREQIQDIIERPIAAVGGRVEPQVVTDLLNSLGTAQDQLPRVEHILLQMWNRVREARKDQPVCLTQDDYRGAGGFEAALNQHADQLYGELGPGPEPGEQSEKQRVAEQLFRSLAVRSPQGTLVRRFSSLGEVASIAGVSEQVVAEVVEHFRQPGCNFLVATPQTPLTGKTTLDISHEALLRQWAKLGKWLDEEAKSAADYCRLEADARSWQKNEKSFLQSPELDISLQHYQKWTSEWAHRYGTDFDLAIQYLKESQAEKKRHDAEEEARRNELAGERARAAQEEQKAARSRRTAIRLVGALALAIALALIAWKQRQIAKEQSELAAKERELATAQSIAARTYLLLGDKLDTALLLATEAQKLATQAQPGILLPDTIGTLLTGAYYNRRLLTYLHGASPVSAVAFSQDGKQVATGDFDGKVVLWDAQKPHQVIKEFPKSENSGLANDAVRAIAFSADGRYMAVSSKSVWLRDLVKGENRLLPPDAGATPPVYALAFSSDSKLLAYGDKKGNIVIRDMMADSAVTLRAVPESPMRGLSFDKDAKVLAAGCSDGRILIWNRQVDEWVEETDRELVPEPADKNGAIDSKNTGVQCLMVSSDGRDLAVGRSSGAVNLYDLSDHSSSLKPVASAVHGRLVSSLAFAPPKPSPEPKLDNIQDSEHLITSGYDGTLRLWEVPSLKQVGDPFTGHVGRVFAVAFSCDSRTVVSGGEDHSAILWDTALKVEQLRGEVFQNPEDRLFSIAFSPDGAYEAVAYRDGGVRLGRRGVELPALRSVAPERAGTKTVPILAFSGDSRRLAVTTADGKLLVCGADAGPTPIEMAAADGDQRITAIALNKDGSLIAAALSQKDIRPQIRIWNVATRELAGGPFDCDEGDTIYTIHFSPDGSRLAAGGFGQAVSIWPLTGGSPPTRVRYDEEHTGSIRDVVFGPDGKTFATASGDRTIILWDAVSGKSISPPLTGHHGPIDIVAFSSDGKLLASGSDDHTVILWEVETGVAIGQLRGHTDTVRALAFSQDGKHLYSGSFPSTVATEDGGLLDWELDPKALMKICHERANRDLSATERNTYLHSVKRSTTSPTPPEPGEQPPLK